ncbi:hypothetical protein D3C74_194900 [compost metagenome]
MKSEVFKNSTFTLEEDLNILAECVRNKLMRYLTEISLFLYTYVSARTVTVKSNTCYLEIMIIDALQLVKIYY